MPSPLPGNFVPNIQVNPSPGFNGNLFEFCSDGLFRDVNTPGNWIQFDTFDANEWILFPALGPPGAAPIQIPATVGSITGQISIPNGVTNFWVCDGDEPSGNLVVKAIL